MRGCKMCVFYVCRVYGHKERTRVVPEWPQPVLEIPTSVVQAQSTLDAQGQTQSVVVNESVHTGCIKGNARKFARSPPVWIEAHPHWR